MKIKRTKASLFFLIFFLICFISSLFYSHKLRSIGFFVIPEPYVIADEHTNVWHGLSLRRTGIPVAWSQLKAYDAGGKALGGDIKGFNVFVFDKPLDLQTSRKILFPVVSVIQLDMGKGLEYMRLVEPYLDHPPFGALILSLGVSKETNTFSDLSAYDMRKVSLYLSIITMILIFFAGWQVSENIIVGFISSTVYGFTPVYLLLSRYAQLENVLSPLFLIVFNILLLLNKIKSPKTIKVLLFLAGVFAGLCAMTKVIGWFAFLFGLIFLFVAKRRFQEILLFVVPSFMIGSLYFIWGLYLNPSLFRDLFFFQGISRGFIGSLNFLSAAVRVGIVNFPFDGWWLGGFLTLPLIERKKIYFPLFLASGIIIFFNLFLGGANFAWYYIPLIPFMSIAVAIFFWEVITKPSFFKVVFFFLVFVSSSLYWGYGVYLATSQAYNYMQPFGAYRLLLLLFFILGILFYFYPRINFLRYSWPFLIFLVFICLVYLNIKSVYFLHTNWGFGKYPSLYTPGTDFVMK